MSADRPFKSVATHIVHDGPITFGLLSEEHYIEAIETALAQAVKEKDDEIYELGHALDYANQLNTDLLKEISDLRQKLQDYESQQFIGRHRSP